MQTVKRRAAAQVMTRKISAPQVSPAVISVELLYCHQLMRKLTRLPFAKQNPPAFSGGFAEELDAIFEPNYWNKTSILLRILKSFIIIK
ncbi:MAG: hypothetical protein ABR955_14760 [Verrucomicrobiota bacterium]|jgi:hypothetical protein